MSSVRRNSIGYSRVGSVLAKQVLDRLGKVLRRFDEEYQQPITQELIASWWVKDPEAEKKCHQCVACRSAHATLKLRLRVTVHTLAQAAGTGGACVCV